LCQHVTTISLVEIFSFHNKQNEKIKKKSNNSTQTKGLGKERNIKPLFLIDFFQADIFMVGHLDSFLLLQIAMERKDPISI